MKKETIIAKNKSHLETLIKKEIKANGNECDLNHIDVSDLNNLSHLFVFYPKFNGDISQWDVSNVKIMHSLFINSEFNGNISNWDVSHVEDMSFMFSNSKFNQTIGDWDVSNVDDMSCMFQNSVFNQDISKWNVSNVIHMESMFGSSKFNQNLYEWKPISLKTNKYIFNFSDLEQENKLPYWAEVEIDFLPQAINAYHLNKRLNQDLPDEINKENFSAKFKV